MSRGPIRQALVVCGGRGTRMASVLGDQPKALLEIGGRPLIHHLLGELAAGGIEEVVLAAGHGAAELRAAAERALPAGVALRCVVEDEPRGTAGAARGALPYLDERFVLALGDLYTALDFGRLTTWAAEAGGLGTLLVHRSSHPADSDVVTVDDTHRIVSWRTRGSGVPASAAVLTNAGLAVFHRELLNYIPRDRPSDLFGAVIPALVEGRAPLHAYLTAEVVRDVGTPARWRSMQDDVTAGVTGTRARLVLVDRDGVVVESGTGATVRPDQVQLIPGAAAGLRRLNQAGILTALVTNQAVVARGLCTPEALSAVHDELRRQLAAEGAHLDRVFHCPHHPETQHEEGVPSLRGPCRCRKPGPGLAEQAWAELGAPPWRTVVVGDSSADMQFALNLGLPGLGVGTGNACNDARFPARPMWRFADLEAAAEWLVRG